MSRQWRWLLAVFIGFGLLAGTGFPTAVQANNPVGPNQWPVESARSYPGYVPDEARSITIMVSSPPGWPHESPPWCIGMSKNTRPAGGIVLTDSPPCTSPSMSEVWGVNPYNPIARKYTEGLVFAQLQEASVVAEHSVPAWYYRFAGGLVANGWSWDAPAWCISWDDYDYAGGYYDYGQCPVTGGRYWRPNPLLFPPGTW